jgi:hypothetical protein
MTSRRFDRAYARELMRRRGTEDAGHLGSLVLPLLGQHRYRPQPTRAKLRAAGDAAVAEWNSRRKEGGR